MDAALRLPCDKHFAAAHERSGPALPTYYVESITRGWWEALLAGGVVEVPLHGSAAVRAVDLAGLHEDPADRSIIATALVHGAALMTADQRLLDWHHPLERHDARR